MRELNDKELQSLYTLAYARETIQSDIKEMIKQQNKIKKSRLYNIGLKIKWLLPITDYLYHLIHLRRVIKEKRQLISLVDQTNLLKSRDETLRMMIEQNKPNTERMLKELTKYVAEEGLFIDYLDRYANAQNDQQFNSMQLTKVLSRKIKQFEDVHLKKSMLEKTAQSFYYRGLPEQLIRMAKEEDVTLKGTYSFQAKLQELFHLSNGDTDHPVNLLDNKWKAYQYIEMLGINHPDYSKTIYPKHRLPEIEGIAIKPLDGGGSRGVYLVYEEDRILDLKRQRVLTCWGDLQRSMEHDLSTKAVKEDQWYYEALIGRSEEEELVDYKFYSFYGETPLLLEIKRYPELKYCWWDVKNASPIQTGKYNQQLFEGANVPQDFLAVVKKISLSIPVPFMRLDFIKEGNSYVFGEFTPFPGNYDEFDNETDRWLGKSYIEAEKRLFKDLLDNKSFSEFSSIKN